MDVLGRSDSDGLRGSMIDLVGRTGEGGSRGDTYYRLRELGVTSTVEKQALAGISIGDLRQIAEFAALGGYEHLPKFHGGGIYRAPAGQSEGPALLRDGETIRTPEQERALAPNIRVIVEDGAVNTDRIKVIADGQIIEAERGHDQFAKAAGV